MAHRMETMPTIREAMASPSVRCGAYRAERGPRLAEAAGRNHRQVEAAVEAGAGSGSSHHPRGAEVEAGAAGYRSGAAAERPTSSPSSLFGSWEPSS
jgi:hypothetical protein